MPIKWTKPKKAEKVPCAECPVPGADAAPSTKHPAPKPKGKGKGKGNKEAK